MRKFFICGTMTIRSTIFECSASCSPFLHIFLYKIMGRTWCWSKIPCDIGPHFVLPFLLPSVWIYLSIFFSFFSLALFSFVMKWKVNEFNMGFLLAREMKFFFFRLEFDYIKLKLKSIELDVFVLTFGTTRTTSRFHWKFIVIELPHFFL